MNLRQTAEVAALASMLSDHIVQAEQPIATSALHAYWKASQLRLKCWFAALRTHPSKRATVASPFHLRQQVCLSREILVAELLTRVWSTVLLTRDTLHSRNECEHLARHVFNGQMEARREVLSLLADAGRLPSRQSIVIDRLRRRVERWTDMLVGPMVLRHGVGDFAVDVQRAQDLGRTQLPLTMSGPTAAAHQLTLVGLSHALPRAQYADEARTTLNLAVARSVLMALPLHMLSPLHSNRSTEQTP